MKFWLLLLEVVLNFFLPQWREFEIFNSIFLICSDLSPVINNDHSLISRENGSQLVNLDMLTAYRFASVPPDQGLCDHDPVS